MLLKVFFLDKFLSVFLVWTDNTVGARLYDDSPRLTCIFKRLDERRCHNLIWHTLHLLWCTQGVPMNISLSQNGYYSRVRHAGTGCSATGGALEHRGNVSRHYGPGSLRFRFCSGERRLHVEDEAAVKGDFRKSMTAFAQPNGCDTISLDLHHWMFANVLANSRSGRSANLCIKY